MAKTKVKLISKLDSQEQVNETLGEIARLKNNINKHEAERDKKKIAIDEQFDKKTADDFKKLEELEQAIALSCESNRGAWFGDKKSIKMVNGTVSFRDGNPKIVQKRGFKVDESIKLIRTLSPEWQEIMLREKVVIAKDEILISFREGFLKEDTLNHVGLQRVQEESFGYDLENDFAESKKQLKGAA
jgi:phage host-nuclease inhibitor protein Gam